MPITVRLFYDRRDGILYNIIYVYTCTEYDSCIGAPARSLYKSALFSARHRILREPHRAGDSYTRYTYAAVYYLTVSRKKPITLLPEKNILFGVSEPFPPLFYVAFDGSARVVRNP